MLIRDVTSTYHHLYQTGRSGKAGVPEMKQVTELWTWVLRHCMWRFTEPQSDSHACGYFTPILTSQSLLDRAVLTLLWDKAHPMRRV